MNISAKTFRKNIWDRFPSGIWLMMGLDTLLTIGWSSASPFLALYLYNVRGLSMSLVGMIFLVGGLMTGATNLLGGMLSDRFGRRRLLIAIAAISTLFSLLLALLIGMSAPILLIIAFFIATRSINGTIGPTTGAIVADLSPRDRLAESYAVVRIGGNLGFAIGPAIGGYLIGFVSYGWLFSISAVVSLAVTALVYFFLRETYRGSKAQVNLRSTLAVAKDRSFLFFVIVSILLVLSIGHLGTTLSVFTVDRLGFTTAQYGLLLTLNGLIVVVLQYPVTRIVERFTKAKGLIIGSLFYVAGYSLLGWIAGFNWAILVIILITAGEVTLTPISSAVVAESAPADKRGRYMGFFTLGQTVGFALSPLFGGVLLDNFPTESRLLWGIIGSVGIVSAVGFAVWGRFYRTNRTGPNAP
jgi:MFS family permease